MDLHCGGLRKTIRRKPVDVSVWTQSVIKAVDASKYGALHSGAGTKATQALARRNKLDMLFPKTYEGNASGKLTGKRYMMITKRYDDEQLALKKKLPALQAEIDEEQRSKNNAATFLRTVKKYTGIEESQLAFGCQKNELTQYAHALGYINLAYYADNGASGLTFGRPDFCQMAAGIQAGKMGAVFVKDFTRLGRDMCQVLQWSNSVKRKGVSILSTGQPGETFVPPNMESISKAYASQRCKKRR